MNSLSYRILLRKEPEGGYTVVVPFLPGCITYGNTIDEAVELAKDAIELYIESLKEHVKRYQQVEVSSCELSINI